MFANIVISLGVMLWLFPLLYFFFGADNMWWITSLVLFGGTIWVVVDAENKTDRIKTEFQTKGNDVFYLYNDCHHNGGDK